MIFFFSLDKCFYMHFYHCGNMILNLKSEKRVKNLQFLKIRVEIINWYLAKSKNPFYKWTIRFMKDSQIILYSS